MPGLKWVKLDLHVHTPASECFIGQSEGEVTPEDIVNAALERGLNGIAITDHMTGAWIDRVKAAAEADGELLVIPGVELSVDYYHVLALFPPEKGTKDIEALLGELKLEPDDHGKSAPPIKKVAPEDVFEIIHRRGGLVVLAHIDCEHAGALAGNTKGSAKIELLNSSNYDAVEIKGDAPPAALYDEKEAKNRGFKRRPPWYRASDNPHPDDTTKHSSLGIGASYSWFSGEETFSLESLRQCFNDPTQRISVSEHSPLKLHPAIVRLDISGGFLDGVSVGFHSGLSSIVGGKGVGKSLIIEFLRLALGDTSSIDAMAADHKGKIASQLGTEGQLYMEVLNDVGSPYGVTVTVTSAASSSKGPSYESVTEIMNLATGEVVEASSSGILPVRAFSQGEIIEISREKSEQLIQLDSFVDLDDIEDSIAQTLEELRGGIEQLVNSRDAQSLVDELREKRGTYKERIKNITKSLQDKAFSDYQKYESAKKEIEEREELWSDITLTVSEARRAISIEAREEVPIEIPSASRYREQLLVAQSTAAQKVVDHLDKAMNAISAAQEGVGSAAEEWLKDLKEKTELYEAHIEKAGGSSKALDSERKKLEGQLSQVEEELETAQDLAGSWNTAWTLATDLADKMDDLLHSRFLAREARANELTAKSEGLLRLTVDEGNSREAQIAALKGIRSSLHIPTLETLAEHIPAHWLVLKLLNPGDGLESGLSTEQFDLLRGKLLSLDTLLATCFDLVSALSDDTPSIAYRRSEGDYAPIESISQGQRCTALIALTLLEGNNPVIIDQPEDSLDVRAIWDDVVQNIRHKKQDRQFIFTTHNSTIAVAGDSDCMTILEPSGTSTSKSHEGSIDVEEIKAGAITHLEGGREAFQLRRRKYNMPG